MDRKRSNFFASTSNLRQRAQDEDSPASRLQPKRSMGALRGSPRTDANMNIGRRRATTISGPAPELQNEPDGSPAQRQRSRSNRWYAGISNGSAANARDGENAPAPSRLRRTASNIFGGRETATSQEAPRRNTLVGGILRTKRSISDFVSRFRAPATDTNGSSGYESDGESDVTIRALPDAQSDDEEEGEEPRESVETTFTYSESVYSRRQSEDDDDGDGESSRAAVTSSIASQSPERPLRREGRLLIRRRSDRESRRRSSVLLNTALKARRSITNLLRHTRSGGLLNNDEGGQETEYSRALERLRSIETPGHSPEDALALLSGENVRSVPYDACSEHTIPVPYRPRQTTLFHTRFNEYERRWREPQQTSQAGASRPGEGAPDGAGLRMQTSTGQRTRAATLGVKMQDSTAAWVQSQAAKNDEDVSPTTTVAASRSAPQNGGSRAIATSSAPDPTARPAKHHVGPQLTQGNHHQNWKASAGARQDSSGMLLLDQAAVNARKYAAETCDTAFGRDWTPYNARLLGLRRATLGACDAESIRSVRQQGRGSQR